MSQREVEYVIVDDGSQDESLRIAQNWARQRANARVLSIPHVGIAGARNAGLAAASGTWVTSVDADDFIGPDYLTEVYKLIALDTQQQLALLSTRVMVTHHETGQFSAGHPLDYKFRRGNRVADLDFEPNAFAIGATTFLRRSVIEDKRLSVDERIAPAFEDGNFILRYLCHFERPLVGLVASAHYFYRRVANGTSAIQAGWFDPRKYSQQIEFGYLAAVDYALAQRKRVPNWVAVAICYDLMHYFKEYRRFRSRSHWAAADHGAHLVKLCERIFERISHDQLQLLRVNTPDQHLKCALVIAFQVLPVDALLGRVDQLKDGGVRISLVHRVPISEIELEVQGRRTQVRTDGSKVHEFYGTQFATESWFTLSSADFAAFAGGRRVVPLSKFNADAGPSSSEAEMRALPAGLDHPGGIQKTWVRRERIEERIWVESHLSRHSRVRTVFHKALRTLTRASTRKQKVDAELRSKVQRLRGTTQEHGTSWVLLDHPDRADDNAEHLYRYLAREHPEIESYFLLERTSRDWERLEEEGFNLLEYGSPEAMAAALSARLVLSSDATEACMYPAPRNIFGEPDYDFIFLQHGVLINDISAWLRGKRISLCLSTTQDEYRSLVWKDSRYDFRASQVALTGLPRHDALLRKAREREIERRGQRVPTRLLVMPTWRDSLSRELRNAETPADSERIFRNSRFADDWWRILLHPRFLTALQNGALQVDFLLHPNIPLDSVPRSGVSGVRFLSAGTISFQESLLACDRFLTDYSSLALDASLVDLPVAFYQTDSVSRPGTQHSWVPGYFDYRTMGPGPVFETADQTVEWIITPDEADDELYRRRGRETLLYRDMKNCARVVEAIRSRYFGQTSPLDEAIPSTSLPPHTGSTEPESIQRTTTTDR